MTTQRTLFLTAIATFASVFSTFATAPVSGPITGLWNTGVDANGAVLPVGSPEQHFIITSSSGAPIEVVNVAAPNWLTPTAANAAAWIGPDIAGANQGAFDSDANPMYWYYHLTFDSSSIASDITGAWASDNSSRINLNGVFTGFEVGDAAFGALTSFVIPMASLQTGFNTLTFAVFNLAQSGGNPSGLIVTGLTQVPDSGTSLILLGLALAGLAAVRRKFV